MRVFDLPKVYAKSHQHARSDMRWRYANSTLLLAHHVARRGLMFSRFTRSPSFLFECRKQTPLAETRSDLSASPPSVSSLGP